MGLGVRVHVRDWGNRRMKGEHLSYQWDQVVTECPLCTCVCAQAELQSTKRQVAQNRATVEQLYEARDGAQNTMLDIKVELDQARAEMQVRCRGTQYIHAMHAIHAGLVTPQS